MRKVLIVDDSRTARSIVQRCLEILGGDSFTYYGAENGLEAMELLRRETVDLVISDLNMPVMDGKRLLLGIKASPKMNHIPVFIITSLGNPALEAELIRIGSEAVIFKPFTPQTLQESLEKVFGKEFFS
jgi:two-component system chemotaxis response regulator CheY